MNSGGYRYGASDQAFYIPAALVRLNPLMFPRDVALIESQARLTTIDEVMAAAVRFTGASLPILLAVLYAATLVLMALAVWLIASRIYRTVPAAVALTAALTLRHAIARTGANSLESYFHPRVVAFALGALAVAVFLRNRRAAPLVLILASALVHPTTALWFAVWIAVAVAVEEPRTRVPLAVVAGVGGLAGVWLLMWGPLAGRLAIMDAEWLATLVTKDYLFPLDWPLEVWAINLAYAPLIAWIYWRRRQAGLLVAGETGVAAGCLSLVLIFAAWLPFNAARVSIAVQLQTARIFWMLDLLATVYVVWALCEGTRPRALRAWVGAALIAGLSTARGSYIMFVTFPERPMVRVQIEDRDWGRAMVWARSSPLESGWIAHPMHAIKYGSSVRVAGERDVFVESVKDTAIGMYDRGTAMRTRDHLAALDDFEGMTAIRARALASREGLDFLVTDRPIAELPLAFQSGALRVYRVR